MGIYDRDWYRGELNERQRRARRSRRWVLPRWLRTTVGALTILFVRPLPCWCGKLVRHTPGDRTRVLPTSQVQPFPGQGPVYSRGEQPSRVPQPTTSIVQTETHHVYRCIADGRLVYYRADALRKASLAFGPPLMLNYKGFPLRSSDSRA